MEITKAEYERLKAIEAANTKMFKVTIARILTNYPAKVFTVQAPDIISAQIRVWRKVKTWHHVIAAEKCLHLTSSTERRCKNEKVCC